MVVARPILAFVSLFVLMGGILLQFLVILSGVTEHNPLNRIYFLQATTGIAGAPSPARWTFFAICEAVNGLNGSCGKAKAALPFDPPKNFGTTTGVPAGFIGTHEYYYLSRFMFAFFLIALFFAVVALFTSLLAICTRIGAYLTGLNTAIALFFQMLAASLMTAWVVKGRNVWRHNGDDAKIGAYGMGLTWGAVGCFLICTVLFCVGGGLSNKGNTAKTGATATTGTTRVRGSSFMRNRSSKDANRGSFIDVVDAESQHRVKTEYE